MNSDSYLVDDNSGDDPDFLPDRDGKRPNDNCSTGPTALFPDIEQCINPPTTFIFGDPYCASCAKKLTELHAHFVKSSP